MTSQARIRLVSEGVVASYIHDISARAHTTDVHSRDDAVLAADHGYSRSIPYPRDTEGGHFTIVVNDSVPAGGSWPSTR